VPLLIALAAVNGTVSAFAFPAAAALIAQTVPEEIRKQANAINRLGINAAMIAGASVGGLVVAGAGPGWGLAIDATTFAIAGYLYALVRVPAVRQHGGPRVSTVRQLREGWTEFIGRTWLWVVVLGFCFFNAADFGVLGVVGPVVADESFGRGSWGLILAAHTVGMAVGAVVAIRIRVRRLLLLGVACCLGGVPLLVALAVVPQVTVIAAMAFIAGLGLEQFGIAWETSMQEHVPADKLARVYSYDALGSFIAIPVGQVAAGPAAEAFGTGPTLMASAGVILLAVVGMLASRDVRTLEHRAAKTPDVSTPPEPVPVT
jgi:MFS family permease